MLIAFVSLIGEQILVYFYAERMLFMRYCFREALKSVRGKF